MRLSVEVSVMRLGPAWQVDGKRSLFACLRVGDWRAFVQRWPKSGQPAGVRCPLDGRFTWRAGKGAS